MNNPTSAEQNDQNAIDTLIKMYQEGKITQEAMGEMIMTIARCAVERDRRNVL